MRAAGRHLPSLLHSQYYMSGCCQRAGDNGHVAKPLPELSLEFWKLPPCCTKNATMTENEELRGFLVPGFSHTPRAWLTKAKFP